MKCMADKYLKKNSYLKSMKWNSHAGLYLNENPYCEKCLLEGNIVPAVKVIHIKEPEGDYCLFWDQKNWQSVCEEHSL